LFYTSLRSESMAKRRKPGESRHREFGQPDQTWQSHNALLFWLMVIISGYISIFIWTLTPPADMTAAEMMPGRCLSASLSLLCALFAIGAFREAYPGIWRKIVRRS